MNENRDYITQIDEAGSVNISEEVIAAIAAAAIMEVEGVAGLSGNLGADLSGKVSRRNLSKGVKVTVEEGKLKVNCAIFIKYGCVISDVAKKVQVSVSAAIENMTGIKVDSVNVHVGGVSFARTAKQ